MQNLNWHGTLVVDEFADSGNPGDPPLKVGGFRVQGITNYETWGGSADVYSLYGTPDADLIFLDRAGQEAPRLTNVTYVNGGAGNDLIDLTSVRFHYGAVTLDGGTGNDWLLGNSGGDRLYGMSGADHLKGYGGNDYLSGGSNNDHLHGGRGNDKLNGGSGHDYLMGQFGKDTLTGGSGNDRFVFDVSAPKSNMDTITDFSVKYDSIHLAKDIFTKAGSKGALKSKAFWSGASAHDADDRVIYNKKTGYLYYDADGTGSADMKVVAKLDKNLNITHKDFFVV